MIQKLKVNNKRITGDDLVVIVGKLNEVIDAINGTKTREPIVTTSKSNTKEDENVPKKPTKVRKTSNQEG